MLDDFTFILNNIPGAIICSFLTLNDLGALIRALPPRLLTSLCNSLRPKTQVAFRRDIMAEIAPGAHLGLLRYLRPAAPRRRGTIAGRSRVLRACDAFTDPFLLLEYVRWVAAVFTDAVWVRDCQLMLLFGLVMAESDERFVLGLVLAQVLAPTPAEYCEAHSPVFRLVRRMFDSRQPRVFRYIKATSYPGRLFEPHAEERRPDEKAKIRAGRVCAHAVTSKEVRWFVKQYGVPRRPRDILAFLKGMAAAEPEVKPAVAGWLIATISRNHPDPLFWVPLLRRSVFVPATKAALIALWTEPAG